MLAFARGRDRAAVTLREYIPVIGNTPPDYLVFCSVVNGKLEVGANFL